MVSRLQGGMLAPYYACAAVSASFRGHRIAASVSWAALLCCAARLSCCAASYWGPPAAHAGSFVGGGVLVMQIYLKVRHARLACSVP